MRRSGWSRLPFLEWFFYGNFFYGICAVAQSAEASLQQRFPLNTPVYYSAVFLATVLYYNYPYARAHRAPSENPRIRWYKAHPRFLFWNQVFMTVLLAGLAVWLLLQYRERLWRLSAANLTLALLFPAVAALYYGSNMLVARHNLRSIGWLKPFVIGFTWAGLIVVYPVLFTDLTGKESYRFTLIGLMLFLKNMMFISVLCIMFDIKDYAGDAASSLKTFVVRLGLRKTIFFILLPLPVLGLLTFITFALSQHFSPEKIAINMVPFLLLLAAAISLRRRRHLMYYLIVIDGLMLVKAACGITAMACF